MTRHIRHYLILIRYLLSLITMFMISVTFADDFEQFLGTNLVTCFSESSQETLHFVINNSINSASTITVFKELNALDNYVPTAAAIPKEQIWHGSFEDHSIIFNISCIDSNYFAFTSVDDYLLYFVEIESNRTFSLTNTEDYDDYFTYLTQSFQLTEDIYVVYGQSIFQASGSGLYLINLQEEKIIHKQESGMGHGTWLFGAKGSKYLTGYRHFFPEIFGEDVILYLTEVSENNQIVNGESCATSIEILVYNWTELLSDPNLENPNIIFSPKGNTQPSVNILAPKSQSERSVTIEKLATDSPIEYSDSQKQSVLACTELLNNYFN